MKIQLTKEQLDTLRSEIKSIRYKIDSRTKDMSGWDIIYLSDREDFLSELLKDEFIEIDNIRQYHSLPD